MKTTQSEERAARNEVLFREANEKLSDKRKELEHRRRDAVSLRMRRSRRAPSSFACPLEQYEHVRSRAGWFLVARGHDARTRRGSKEREDGYVIIEKTGLAGRIAEEENPRG